MDLAVDRRVKHHIQTDQRFGTPGPASFFFQSIKKNDFEVACGGEKGMRPLRDAKRYFYPQVARKSETSASQLHRY